ncbi:MAG: hypothetical protein MZU95_09520 [Desulfomicrobium escambiense]|nr:hypothetical protein [Desulfomicrobium escambiense]
MPAPGRATASPVRGAPAHRQRSPSCARCHGATAPARTAGSSSASPATPVIEAKSELADDAGASRRRRPWWPCSASPSGSWGAEAVDAAAAAGDGHAPRGGRRARRCAADEGRPDELGGAARGFDATLAALRRSQAELEAFYRERMVRADRFAAVGEIATGLAHEIKNPLAGLSGALELLAEDLARRTRATPRWSARCATRCSGSPTPWRACSPSPGRQARRLRATDVNVSIEKVLFLIRQQCRGGLRWTIVARAGRRGCRTCWRTPRSSSRSSSTSASTPSRPWAGRWGVDPAVARGGRPVGRGGGHRPGHPGRPARPRSSSPGAADSVCSRLFNLSNT